MFKRRRDPRPTPRHQALSRRGKRQCMAPATKGKHVCSEHGGRLTGPKIEQGRKRCAAAKTSHGRETRAKRELRAELLIQLRAWRREGDSNPRYGFKPYNGLANRRLRPLGHRSKVKFTIDIMLIGQFFFKYFVHHSWVSLPVRQFHGLAYKKPE